MDKTVAELKELQDEKEALENRYRELVIRERTLKSELRQKEMNDVSNTIVDVDPDKPPYASQKEKVDRLLELIVPERNRYRNVLTDARLKVRAFTNLAKGLDIQESQDSDFVIFSMRKLYLDDVHQQLWKLTSL